MHVRWLFHILYFYIAPINAINRVRGENVHRNILQQYNIVVYEHDVGIIYNLQ